MTFSLFSATGCMRCKIVKSYMKQHSIGFEEFDFKADGKDAFNAFYRKNRSSIFRGEEGVEFPLLYDGQTVVQGVGVIIAWLENKDLLDTMVTRSDLSHGWVSGLTIVPADKSVSDSFVKIVSFLKDNGLQTQIESKGANSLVLEQLIEKKLIDRFEFILHGPAEIYETAAGFSLAEKELADSLALLEKCPEYKIILPVLPFLAKDGQKQIIAPETAAKAAEFVAQTTGKKTHPFYVKDEVEENDGIGEVNLFKYRTACRRFMVKTEILKA